MIKVEPLDFSEQKNKKFMNFYLDGVEKCLNDSFKKGYRKANNIDGPKKQTISEKNRQKDTCNKMLKEVKLSINQLVKFYLKLDVSFNEFLFLSSEDQTKFVEGVKGKPEKFNQHMKDFKIHYDCMKEAYNLLVSHKESEVYGIKPFNYLLVETLGINICPYCNRNYINGRGDEKKKRSGAQLDHFRSRSQYKIFSVSINNLIPSCPQCNHIKAKEDFKCSPFMKKSEHLPVFKITSGKRGFILESPNDEYTYQKDVLKLDELYSIHYEEFKELELRSRIYNSNRINEMEQVLGVSLTDQMVQDFIFGTIHKASEDKKYSLSKFRREIVDELREDKRKS